MKKTVGLILIGVTCFVIAMVGGGLQPLEAKKENSLDNLAPKYKKWWNEVTYIITKNERRVFLRLTTDRERDIFMNAFWSHRDPTKGTPENEFKMEHYQRLKAVEQLYSRGGRREGWKTDRGKVYIILGPPLSIQRFTTYSKIYPTEVWHYQQEPKAGIPPAFTIVFYDKNNVGEYVLYSPIGDGPQKLLIGFQGKPDDYYSAYEQLKEFNSFLADTSISLVPGEEMAPGRPSMSSDFLLRNIEISPQKNVEDIYAKKFLQYKGIVEVEYSVNYILSRSLSQLIKDKNGNRLFHYMIEFKKLTVDQFDDFYYTNIEVYGSLTDDSGKNVYQFEKTFNLKLNPQQFQTIQGSSFAIADQFPIIPGDYKLSILLKNTNSHEFTAYETDVSVPSDSGELYLSPALLAYEVKGKGLPSVKKDPFRTTKGHLLVEPENKFSRMDQMNVFFQLFGASAELRDSGKIKIEISGEKNFTRDITRNLSEFAANETDFLLEIPLKDFPSDYYSLVLSVIDGNGSALVSREQRFLITPLATVARPQIFSKSFALDDQSITAFILGSQYMNIGKPSRALSLLKKANNLNPQVMQFALGLARIYLDLDDYAKIPPLLMPFINDEKPDFQLYFLLGTVNQKTGNYKEAVTYYRRLITYHGLNVDVLNALASCHYNLGDIKEARRAWEESLKVEPSQEKVKKALRGLKNEKSTPDQKK